MCPDVPESNQCAHDDWWAQALNEAEVDLFGLVGGDSSADRIKCSEDEKSLPDHSSIIAAEELSNPPNVVGSNVSLPHTMELASSETLDHSSAGLLSVQPGGTICSDNENAVLHTADSSGSDNIVGSEVTAADGFEDAEGLLDADLLLQLPIPPSFVPLSDEEGDDECGPRNDLKTGEDIAFLDKEDADADFDEASALEALTHIKARYDLAAQSPVHNDQFGVDEEHTADLPDPQSPWSVKFPPQHILDSVPDHTLPDAYIEQASLLITKAIQLESQEDYHEAFDLFKAGVDLLLNGVQSMYRCT